MSGDKITNLCRLHPNHEAVMNAGGTFTCGGCLNGVTPEVFANITPVESEETSSNDNYWSEEALMDLPRDSGRPNKIVVSDVEYDEMVDKVGKIVRGVEAGNLEPGIGVAHETLTERALQGIFDVFESVGRYEYEENVPEEFVPKDFEMDPETDDLLFDGMWLKNDMKVLIEDDEKRGYVMDGKPVNPSMVRKYNRWATVSQVRADPYRVQFIGLFDDGTKKKFVEETSQGWYVKKDSVVSVEEEEHSYDEMMRKVRDVVQGILMEQYGGDEEHAKEVSVEISDSLEAIYAFDPENKGEPIWAGVGVSGFVDRDQPMDPKTEQIIEDAFGLRDGMKILIADPRGRFLVRETIDQYPSDIPKMLEVNRWCTISNVVIEGNIVKFFGKYEDGGIYDRRAMVGASWIVKKVSIP